MAGAAKAKKAVNNADGVDFAKRRPLKMFIYKTHAVPAPLVPGVPERDWMDATGSRHAYRCLPLSMANTTGWDFLCPCGFTLTWNGGPRIEDQGAALFHGGEEFELVAHQARPERGVKPFLRGFWFFALRDGIAAGLPRGQPAARPALLRAQLRGPAREPGRERAVRLRQRRLHRRAARRPAGTAGADRRRAAMAGAGGL